MELGSQIKKYRGELKLSQEELAEKVYVTRQTVSNWENEKSYPDIHSLLLLSSLFEISLDQLIKGDIDIMKKEIDKAEIERHNHLGNIFAFLFIARLISFIPLVKFLQIIGIAIWVVLFGITMVFAVKIHKLQKENDISTYKEIVAFTEGKKLDEISKQREIGKRPYQTVLKLLFGAGTALIVLFIMGLIFGGI
ncbi:MAG: helix-turn-helix transcriptional regulator [Ruminiclostridium sp.]|nr:helix-turn-helix transcriptional regulator [Ruminiclostridium sp.]